MTRICAKTHRSSRTVMSGATRGGTPPLRPSERGYALLMALLILVISALLAVSVYRSFGLQGRIAGNTLDKQRAYQAAESTLRFGEWWLTQGGAGSGVACAGTFDANQVKNMRVCDTLMTTQSAAALPWSVGGTYTPNSLTVQAGGGQTAAGDVFYASSPMVYIAYIGPGPDGRSQLYQVNAVAYGGSATTATVLQSTYQMSQRVRNLGEP